jgi:hypothetical protein
MRTPFRPLAGVIAFAVFSYADTRLGVHRT